MTAASKKPDFILNKSKTATEVVALLLERFPDLREVVDSADELELAEPFHAYECFASEIQRRIQQREFLEAAAQFINELTESNDPLIRDVLVTSVFERIAEDKETARKIALHIGQKANSLLEDVESKIYKRFH